MNLKQTIRVFVMKKEKQIIYIISTKAHSENSSLKAKHNIKIQDLMYFSSWIFILDCFYVLFG